MSGAAANIGPRGARRRRTGGIAWLSIGAALALAGLVADVPVQLLALLVIPFSLGVLGLLQAREKT